MTAVNQSRFQFQKKKQNQNQTYIEVDTGLENKATSVFRVP